MIKINNCTGTQSIGREEFSPCPAFYSNDDT